MKSIKTVSLAMLITMSAVGYVLAEGNTINQNAQTNCPVMGGTINKALYADYEGKRVYFCCEGCVPEFQKDPVQYLKKFKNTGVILKTVPTAELKNKSNPSTDSDCNKNNSCGGCGGCGCS